MKATIIPDEIAVNHCVQLDVGREFLSFKIDGWDEVKKLTKKVLLFDNRKFIFSCWNSDRMEIIFYCMLDGSTTTAKVCKK
jgi:hypothetical protein